MEKDFSLAHFILLFPDDDTCLEEIKKIRFPYGIHCGNCKSVTRHYKLNGRVAYSCKFCRKHVYPLAGTIFEKSSTPLHVWFYALFLMTHSLGSLTGKQLQRELGVTYKTAWRMRTYINILMEQNNGDLLKDPMEREYKEHKWVFFNKLEIKFVQKQESSEKNDKK
jgi:transposase